MDWSKGFSASYYMTIVDPITWRDTDRIETTGGSVSRRVSGLCQSADISCVEFPYETEQWVRVWMDATQDGSTVHEAIFTGLTGVSERSLNGTLSTIPLSCYSVLKPAQDIPMDKGSYYMTGTIGADAVRELFSVSPAPIVVEGVSPRLSQTIVAEGKETRLTMANKILTAINWRLRIDGDGTIRIGAWDDQEAAVFGLRNDVITPKLRLKADWFRCPNVVRVTSGEQSVTVVDDSPSSSLSTVVRGREIWLTEDNVSLGSDEGLTQYAARRLREEQAYAYTVGYSRRFDPSVNVTDTVRLHYPEQGLMNRYTVTSQTIRLGSAIISEEVQR